MSNWIVSQIVLRAAYIGHAPDESIVECTGVFDESATYSLQIGADGSGQHSLSSPPVLICQGVNVAAIEGLGWTPTSVIFSATNGESIEVQVDAGSKLNSDTYQFIKRD
jgi:hypothetical protein